MENGLISISDEILEKIQNNELSDELRDQLRRELEGIKTTISILQNKELMETIEETDRLLKKGVKPEEFTY